MSRIINADSAGKLRAQLVKAIAIALRELSRQSGIGDETRDLAAFIAIALGTIAEGIDTSVAAWEKRGYWVKADRFRMEWAWAAPISSKLQDAIRAADWSGVAVLSAQIAGKIPKVRVSEHHKMGKPWIGAFERMSSV